MGHCVSRPRPDRGNLSKSVGVNEEGPAAPVSSHRRRRLKVLLLGSSESGKSTILKQMRLRFGSGIEAKVRRLQFRDILIRNCVQCVRTIVRACHALSISLMHESREAESRVMAVNVQTDSIDALRALLPDLLCILKDNAILTKQYKFHEYHFMDNEDFFLGHIEEIFADHYLPSDSDILHCRQQTSGINESDFDLVDDDGRRIALTVVDVGGQEQHEWIHSFDNNVDAVLWVASLNEYDQVLVKDRSKNRLEASLNLFEAVLGLPWLKNTAVFIFLNKADLFEKKMEDSRNDLGVYFPAYKGGTNDFEAGLLFIRNLYLARLKKLWARVADAKHRRIFYARQNHSLLSSRSMGSKGSKGEGGSRDDFTVEALMGTGTRTGSASASASAPGTPLEYASYPASTQPRSSLSLTETSGSLGTGTPKSAGARRKSLETHSPKSSARRRSSLRLNERRRSSLELGDRSRSGRHSHHSRTVVNVDICVAPHEIQLMTDADAPYSAHSASGELPLPISISAQYNVVDVRESKNKDNASRVASNAPSKPPSNTPSNLSSRQGTPPTPSRYVKSHLFKHVGDTTTSMEDKDKVDKTEDKQTVYMHVTSATNRASMAPVLKDFCRIVLGHRGVSRGE